jgi:hypothetical protein
MVRMPANTGGVNRENRIIPRNVRCRTHNTCPGAVPRTMIVYAMRDEPVAARLKEARMAHVPITREDLYAVLAYATLLSQIKRVQAIAA